MKRIMFWFSFLLVASLLVGCGGVTIDLGGTSASTTYSLEAVIDSPLDGSTLAMQPSEISYHATAQDGVAAVELSVDGQVVNIYTPPDTKVPVTAVKYTWTPTVSGAHVIRVRGMSSTGEWSPYAQATINVQAADQQVAQPTAQSPAAPSATNTPQPTPTLEGVQLISLTKDNNIFHYGANSCGPMKVTFTIKLSNPQDIKYAYVFARLFSNEGEGTSSWDGGHVMTDRGNGEYSFTFEEKYVYNPSGFDRATLNYQFVIKDKSNGDLLRTSVYKDVTYNSCP